MIKIKPKGAESILRESILRSHEPLFDYRQRPLPKAKWVTRVTPVTTVTHCAACGQRLPTAAAAKQRAYRERKKAHR